MPSESRLLNAGIPGYRRRAFTTGLNVRYAQGFMSKEIFPDFVEYKH